MDAFLASKQHPLEEDLRALRKAMARVAPSIREEIKWNSISFCNEHDFFATVNLRSTDSVQLVFHTGVKKKSTAVSGVDVADPHGLIEKWQAKDRCVVTLGRGAAFRANKPALTALVRDWLRFVNRE